MRPCWAQADGDYCRNHDPAEAERRKRAGSVRHPRFKPDAATEGMTVSGKTVPTIAHVIDSALRVAEAAEAGDLEAASARAAVEALKLAHGALVGEREYVDKARFAWEAWQRSQGQQGTAREKTGEGEGGASSEQPAASTPPPWMQPRPTN